MKKYLLVLSVVALMFMGGGYALAGGNGCCNKSSCGCVKAGCCVNGTCACKGGCCTKDGCACADAKCGTACDCKK